MTNPLDDMLEVPQKPCQLKKKSLNELKKEKMFYDLPYIYYTH